LRNSKQSVRLKRANRFKCKPHFLIRFICWSMETNYINQTFLHSIQALLSCNLLKCVNSWVDRVHFGCKALVH